MSNAILVLLIILLVPGSLLGFDVTTQENVLVFNSEGEPVSSYHIGDWSNTISPAGTVNYQIWAPGSPPVYQGNGTLAISLQAGFTALPNMVGGASATPPPGIPEVSLYSFDTAMYDGTLISEDYPGETPGVSVSPSPGSYDYTVGVEIRASAVTGTPVVEIWKESLGTWVQQEENPAIVSIASSRELRVRAVNNGSYSVEKQLQYTIIQPPLDSSLLDSDGDGFPDIWEVENNLDPFTADRLDKSRDSDDDGYSDLDELLRGTDPYQDTSTPLDTDGDGWSDWDELRRGTSPSAASHKPTATRLYEVEAELSGIIERHDGPLMLSPYVGERLDGLLLMLGDTGFDGGYQNRLPVGNASIIRAYDRNDSLYVLKRYLASQADPVPADMGFTVADCFVDIDGGIDGDIDNCHTTWEQAWVDWLDTHLVITLDDYSVTPLHMAPIAVLERQIEILSGPIPEDVAQRLPDGTSSEPYLAFGANGHRPPVTLLADLLDMLQTAKETRDGRSINSLMLGIYEVLQNQCVSILSTISTIYSSHEAPPAEDRESVEEMVSLLLQESEGSYLAGLLLRYSMAELQTGPDDLCQILSGDADLDGDSLVNKYEVPTLENNNGESDLFTTDTDQDFITDDLDNCPGVINPAQADNDLDGVGDLCDNDDDNDGLEDGLELVVGSNPFVQDTNGDGTGDLQEWEAGSDPGIQVYALTLISPSNQAEQTITGYREPGSTVVVQVDGGAQVGTVIYDTDSEWSCQLTSMDSDQVYHLSITANDGGVRVGYGRAEIVIDTVLPIVTVVSPSQGVVLNDTTPILTFIADEGHIQVSLDGAPIRVKNGGELGPLTDGSHTVTVNAVDWAGNIGSAFSAFTIIGPPAADIDGNGDVDFVDVIIILKFLAGEPLHVVPTDQYLPGSDNRWGLEEVLYIMGLQ